MNEMEPAPVETSAEERDANMWAMFLHLSLLAGFVVPFGGLIAPIIIWQVKKKDIPSIDEHGKVVVNWLISAIIYAVVSTILVILVVGIFLLIVLGILSVIFPIIGGIKANNGELWKYPLTINFIK